MRASSIEGKPKSLMEAWTDFEEEEPIFWEKMDALVGRLEGIDDKEVKDV
jgi:hypothetical protein